LLGPTNRPWAKLSLTLPEVARMAPNWP